MKTTINQQLIKALLFGFFVSIILLSCRKVKEDASIMLKAVPFDSHVELQWESAGEGLEYRVLAKRKNEKEFILRSTTKDTIILDFVTDLGKGQELVYKVEAELKGVKKSSTQVSAVTRKFTEDELIDMGQYYTFRYFWQGVEPNSGLATERHFMDGEYPPIGKHVLPTGSHGFGLLSFPVAVERGWITNNEALDRLERILAFLETADRFHGVGPHQLNGTTGKVQPFIPNDGGGDLVEPAFLMQGLLAIRQHYAHGNKRERTIASRINKLWGWDWYAQGKDVLYWHWSPNVGWAMNFPLEDYNECLITYGLAAASPTHTSAENRRTGIPWKLYMSTPIIQARSKELGIENGMPE